MFNSKKIRAMEMRILVLEESVKKLSKPAGGGAIKAVRKRAFFKTPDDVVAEVMILASKGKKRSKIAKKLGISYATVYRLTRESNNYQ